jgi:hypothetical protein
LTIASPQTNPTTLPTVVRIVLHSQNTPQSSQPQPQSEQRVTPDS